MIGTSAYYSTPTYNSNGTVGKLTTATSAQITYGYDDMLRLSSAVDNCQPSCQLSQTYTYDQYGNLSTNGSPYSFLPTYTSSNQIQMSGISYDADGNMLTDLDHTYTWDANDMVSSIDGHAITRDAFGRMVENAANGDEIFYGHYGHTVMQGQTLYFSQTNLPGGGRVLIQPNGTFFLRPDFQGNAALISQWNQTLGCNPPMEYSPFGQMYNDGCFGVFNDGNADVGSFLWDTPNRELHGKEGRWISPDPSGIKSGNLGDPQSLNLYRYASNNALSFSDPSGLNDIPFWSAPWNGPGMYANGGWGGVGCTVDGFACGTTDIAGIGGLGGNSVAALPSGLGTITPVEGGFAFPSVAADGSVNYSFSFGNQYSYANGTLLTNAYWTEVLGLPTGLELLAANNGTFAGFPLAAGSPTALIGNNYIRYQECVQGGMTAAGAKGGAEFVINNAPGAPGSSGKPPAPAESSHDAMASQMNAISELEGDCLKASPLAPMNPAYQGPLPGLIF
jgi:RHS repeat-associated protein